MIKNLPDRIFLCGFMGAGKSTIGQRLAEKLSLPFLDLDQLIEKKAGQSITDIFVKEGERVFRTLERESLLEVIRNCKGIVALGGGTFQNQHMVDHVKVNGLLIFIETPFSVILERIRDNPDRPLLLKEDGSLKDEDTLTKELNSLYRQRLGYYEQAELRLSPGENEPAEQMVDRLIKKIRYHVAHH